jgi:hypothetical protein
MAFIFRIGTNACEIRHLEDKPARLLRRGEAPSRPHQAIKLGTVSPDGESVGRCATVIRLYRVQCNMACMILESLNGCAVLDEKCI